MSLLNYILYIFVIVAVADLTYACHDFHEDYDYDYYRYNDCYNSSSYPLKQYYIGMHLKANYYEALEFCNYHNMRLATINSQEENERLVKRMELMGIGSERVWLSGSDLGHEGKFIWMTTGFPLTYTNFIKNQPDNYKNVEHCLELRDHGKWNDFECNNKLYFICEYK